GDVGVGDEVQPAAGADTVDGGDHRLPDPAVDGGQAHLAVEVAALLRRRGCRRPLAHVEPGAEPAAGPGDDDDDDLGVVVELLPGGRQLASHRTVDGVEALGPVEGEG